MEFLRNMAANAGFRASLQMGRRGAQNISKSVTKRISAAGSSTANNARREISPFLLGFSIFPFFTVQAISWRKSDANESPKLDPNSTEAKLRNKNDIELLKDLKLADRTYEVDEGISHNEIYNKLAKHLDKREPELLWRLARVTYELSKKAKSTEKARLVNEAFETVQKALEIDDKNFAVHKWMAILLNARSTLLGTKEQITQSYNVRVHMEKAAVLNPKDATSIYLLGNWCFTIAEIPWYQKKIASTIFATPPSCSFQEAVQHFLKAESADPLFYSMNLLMLAKSYLRLNEPENAEIYLLKLKELPMKTDDDYQARQEGKELLDTILKSKKHTATDSNPNA